MTKCKIIKERMEQKESETVGKWMTEEAMKKSGLFSATAIKNILKYCQKFPESLIRRGCCKYGHQRRSKKHFSMFAFDQ